MLKLFADAEPPLDCALDEASALAEPPPDAIAFDAEDAWALASEPVVGNRGNHLIMTSPSATASFMDCTVASFSPAEVNTKSSITVRSQDADT